MTEAIRELTRQVHGLMTTQAELLDELDRSRRDARRERDELLLGFLEIMDSALRALEMVKDEEARGVLSAIERQIELTFNRTGMATYTFEPGVIPPIGEIEVVTTHSEPGMADLAVVRTVHPGLRDNERIIRKAAVEINKTARAEEA